MSWAPNCATRSGPRSFLWLRYMYKTDLILPKVHRSNSLNRIRLCPGQISPLMLSTVNSRLALPSSSRFRVLHGLAPGVVAGGICTNIVKRLEKVSSVQDRAWIRSYHSNITFPLLRLEIDNVCLVAPRTFFLFVWQLLTQLRSAQIPERAKRMEKAQRETITMK